MGALGAEEGTVSPEALRDEWPALTPDERVEAFRRLPGEAAGEFFLTLSPLGQAQVLTRLPDGQRRLWVRLLPPDDAADLVQALPEERREALLLELDPVTQREVRALLAYAEDDAGGLMSPRFARVRPAMSVDEALAYLRRQARERVETIYYAYVLGADQRLLGVVSFRELFAAPAGVRVRDVMRKEPIAVREDTDQETVARLFAEHDLLALPVVDGERRMRGIVTVDDIVDVVEEEATEDQQKYGGMEALDEPYLQTSLGAMVRKRGGWLAILLIGEMLTASAMARYEDEIARAVVLAVFVPLIIASGGNSGSQASTLVVRAMALGEVRPRDWWRIVRREVFVGVALGSLLATLGFARVVLWEALFGAYGEHAALVGVTVALALLGVVTLGTVAGSMLPFVLRALGFDPASASAPFVATLVDVSGLVIYFTVASLVLGGTLL